MLYNNTSKQQPPRPPPTHPPIAAFFSLSFRFWSRSSNSWAVEIKRLQPLLLLYLACLPHPLIVFGLPSAAWETAKAQRTPLQGVMFPTWGHWPPRHLQLSRSECIHVVQLFAVSSSVSHNQRLNNTDYITARTWNKCLIYIWLHCATNWRKEDSKK